MDNHQPFKQASTLRNLTHSTDCLIFTLLDCPLLTPLIAFYIFILPIHQNANMMLDQKSRGYNGIGPTPR
jgi:hypothetical protein